MIDVSGGLNGGQIAGVNDSLTATENGFNLGLWIMKMLGKL
jgi:hypothetical protein